MADRKGNRKSLLSYKGRIIGQPAVEKVTIFLRTRWYQDLGLSNIKKLTLNA